MSTKGVRAYSPQSYGSLERSAVRVRACLLPGRSETERVPGLELFERLDEYAVMVRSKQVRLQYAVEDLPDGIEAQAHHSLAEDAIVVALAEPTYQALQEGKGRALFTLCHEIGHAVLHPAELMDRRAAATEEGALHRGSAREHRAFLDTEWQANGFAGAMLMPARGLASLEAEGLLDAGSIWRRFSVSREAAERRLAVFRGYRNDLLG